MAPARRLRRMNRTLPLLLLASALAAAGCTAPQESRGEPDGAASAAPNPTPEAAPVVPQIRTERINASAQNASAEENSTDDLPYTLSTMDEADCAGRDTCLHIREVRWLRGTCILERICADDGRDYVLMGVELANPGEVGIEVSPFFFTLEVDGETVRPTGQAFVNQGLDDNVLMPGERQEGTLAFETPADEPPEQLCYDGFSRDLEAHQSCHPFA